MTQRLTPPNRGAFAGTSTRSAYAASVLRSATALSTVRNIGDVPEAASLINQMMPAMVQAVAGRVTRRGYIEQAMPAIVQQVSAHIIRRAAVSQMVPAIIQAVAGRVTKPSDASQTMPAMEQSATGRVIKPASVDQSMPPVTHTAAGRVIKPAVISQDMAAMIQNITARVIKRGAIAQVMPAMQQAVAAEASAPPAGSPTIEGFTLFEAATAATSSALTLPSGVAENELLVILFSARSTASHSGVFFTPPAGYTEAIDSQAGSSNYDQAGVFWKIATSSESNPTVVQATSSKRAAIFLRISNVNTSSPIATANALVGTASNILTNSVTGTEGNLLIVSFQKSPSGTNIGTSLTVGTVDAEIAFASTDNTSGGSQIRAFRKELTASGLTGTFAIAAGGSSQRYNGILLEIAAP